ncbi:hypothetical protein OESDEN_18430, partial [Oesophagostomum dentatum]
TEESPRQAKSKCQNQGYCAPSTRNVNIISAAVKRKKSNMQTDLHSLLQAYKCPLEGLAYEYLKDPQKYGALKESNNTYIKGHNEVACEMEFDELVRNAVNNWHLDKIEELTGPAKAYVFGCGYKVETLSDFSSSNYTLVCLFSKVPLQKD